MAEQDGDRDRAPRPHDRAHGDDRRPRPAGGAGAGRGSQRDGRPPRQGRPERPARAGQEGGPQRHARAGQEGGPQRHARAGQEGGPQRHARAGQEGGPQRHARAGQEGRPERHARAGQEGRPRRSARPDGSAGHTGAGAPRRPDQRRGTRPPQDSERRRSDAPELPEALTARDLHPAARNELKTLSKENAEQVARHLAMAASVIDDDPALALRHAQAASRRAGRVAVVRETVAIAAYATGDFALALRELRTYRRISGRDDQIALIVDSERGVGRPDRAIEAAHAVDVAALPPALRVELAIALSGARLDLGDPERALLELDIPELDPSRAFEYSPGLFAARAAVLEDLGRDDEAAQWRHRADVAVQALDEAAAPDDLVVVEEILEEALESVDGSAAGASAAEPPAESPVASAAEPEAS